MEKQARCFVFTLNNPNDQSTAELQTWLTANCRYAVYGREVAPTTGTIHLQGYFECSSPKRYSTLRGCLPRGIHLESRKGTRDQAIQYCKKDGDIWEHGEAKSNQGKRTDLDSIRRIAVERGMRGVSEVASHQEIKVAESFLTWNEEPREWKPSVYWFYGSTGLGKSRRARYMLEQELGFTKADIYTKSDGTKWWPGYDGHACVIIDDFRPSWWSITEMLSLLDRYEKKVEFKGGYRQFRPKAIVVTSCLAPRQCYEGTGEAVEQLVRRIDQTDHFVYEWLPPIGPNVGGDLQTPGLDVPPINSQADEGGGTMDLDSLLLPTQPFIHPYFTQFEDL